MKKTTAHRILARLGKIALEKARMANDKDLVIEAEAFEVGQTAWVLAQDGERIPLPKGVFPLDNGMEIVTDDMGIIIKIN